MNPEQLSAFIMERKWVALAAVVIGLIVRLLKSDTKIPIDIAPQYRIWLALALGGAAGALDKLSNQEGVTWTSALVQGVVAAVIAIVSHNAFIESLNGGKELNIPGLIKPGEPPSPGKPPTLPPPPDVPSVNTPITKGPLALLFAFGAVLLCTKTIACGYGATACKIVDVAHETCAVLRYLEADGTVRETPITQSDAREFAHALAAKRAAASVDAGAGEAGAR